MLTRLDKIQLHVKHRFYEFMYVNVSKKNNNNNFWGYLFMSQLKLVICINFIEMKYFEEIKTQRCDKK